MEADFVAFLFLVSVRRCTAAAAANENSTFNETQDNFKLMSKLRGHRRGVKSLAVHPSGKLALSCDQESYLCMWNLIRGKVSCKNKLDSAIEELVLSRLDNRYVGRTRDSLVLRDLEDAEMDLKLEMPGKTLLSMCYPGSNYVVAGCSDGTVCTWDVRANRRSHEFKAHARRVKGLAVPFDLSANGGLAGEYPTYFASASSEGDLKLWDTRMVGDSSAAKKEEAGAKASGDEDEEEKEGEGGAGAVQPVTVSQLRVRLTCMCAKEPDWEQSAAQRKEREADEEEAEENGGDDETEPPSARKASTLKPNHQIRKKKKNKTPKKYQNLKRFD